MDPRTSIIDKRLTKINRIIAVASGKGGVGKSLVASALALSLSKNYNVGLLDLDLYGPSSHIILGASVNRFPEEEKGIIPPNVHGIKFMSLVYFTEDKPSPFRGLDISNIIIELLSITQWGKLDFLIIDLPPGIGDETLDVIKFIKKGEFLIVTTPSKVSMGAVSKLCKILIELKLPIIGIIENMKISDSSYTKDEMDNLKIKYIGNIKFDRNLEDTIGSPNQIINTDFMKELSAIVKNLNL